MRMALTWASIRVEWRMLPTLAKAVTPCASHDHLKRRQFIPSLWQTTALRLNIKVDALFFGRDILLKCDYCEHFHRIMSGSSPEYYSDHTGLNHDTYNWLKTWRLQKILYVMFSKTFRTYENKVQAFLRNSILLHSYRHLPGSSWQRWPPDIPRWSSGRRTRWCAASPHWADIIWVNKFWSCLAYLKRKTEAKLFILTTHGVQLFFSCSHCLT